MTSTFFRSGQFFYGEEVSMLDFGIILIGGYIFQVIFEKLKLTKVFGMIIYGMLIGPYALNLLSTQALSLSSTMRTMALLIVLTRAGLSLRFSDLKQMGRPAICLTFVPALFEIAGVVFFATQVLKISLLDALMLGSVLAAVSPAIIVPRMIYLMDEKYGEKHKIPQMIMAGASVDDVVVMVLFSSFISLSVKNTIELSTLINLPISIILGVLIGCIIGWILSKVLKNVVLKEVRLLIVFSAILLVYGLQTPLENILPYASLLSVMSLAMIVNEKLPQHGEVLIDQFKGMWFFAEIFLFVYLGTEVNIQVLSMIEPTYIVLILFALSIRLLGVYVSLFKTKLTSKEKLFCMIAYIPKATVQAAIGGIALSMNLEIGQFILIMAVLSILISAPLGAIGIDQSYKKLLEKN